MSDAKESYPSASAGFPATDSDLSGRRLGDYQILRQLGHGGMAVVYLAEQRSLRRKVAVKVLKPELAVDEQYVRRFRNEAQSAATLVHANIVQIHEVGCVDNLQFITQEYVPGQNLRQLLDRQITVDAEQATAILRQVAAALRKAGQHGIVHRDIKPENILIATDGAVKVADFGLARRNQRQDGLELTQVGITMGTPLYMSPEQVEGQQLDCRTDVYSLGVTAYHMLAGHPPFEGDTPLSVALKHVKQQPKPISEVCPDLPPELCRIVHRMLAKSPADRYADGNELLADLEALPVAGGRSADTSSLSGVAVAPPDGPISGQSTYAETQQLANVLAQQRTTRLKRMQRKVAWPMLAAGLMGAAIAVATQRSDPLGKVPETEASVPRKSTAESQFFYANMVDTEAAWLAVEEYFPIDDESNERQRLLLMRAKQQLARWYIEDERPRDALPLLAELSHLEDGVQNDVRAAGLAWQAIALEQLGEFNQAADALSSAFELAEHLDEPLVDRLDDLRDRLKSQLQ